MQKFRSHKSRIVHSKRDSQKIDQLDLLTLSRESHLQKSFLNLAHLMKQKLHTMTDAHYKINTQNQEKMRFGHQREFAEPEITPKDESNFIQQSINTKDYSANTKSNNDIKDASPAEDQSSLENILILMNAISNPQQSCAAADETNQQLKKEIKIKVTEFKQLLGKFQDSYQSSLLDFYNEQNGTRGSPNSFHSRSSEQAEPENTDREAYQMAQRQNFEKENLKEEDDDGKLQLKYRRITESTQSFDTFSEDAEKDYQSSQQQLFSNGEDKQNRSLNESSIIHLFSYQRQRCLQSPLPSITERSSQYCSPNEKYPATQLFSQSLEYKKIFYLLQTTEKKKEAGSSTKKHEVSQFLFSSRTNKSNSKSSICENIDRSKSHSQLKDMINLLQNKYKRPVQKDSQNPKKSLDAVLNSKSIKLRTQR